MCGIAGFWDQGHRFENQEHILKMAAHVLAHRGPDAEGLWLSQNKEVGLIHRRLAIIDLNERSSQPMVSGSRRSVITFNGEIYNFQTLRQNQGTFDWKTQSDTEVLLECIEARGELALNDLDGMFAFVQYDEKQNEMLLAVDPFGKKPLYTYWDGRTFAFASEIKGLKALGLRLELSPEHLNEYLLFGAPFGSATVFKNVRRLQGGFFQKIKDGRPRKAQPYWDLPLGQINHQISYQDAMENSKLLIRSAVRKRLVADVPIGCFLSGGLDSSVVAYEAQAALKSGTHLQTFSVGFPGSDWFDESPYAKRVAERIGADFHLLDGKMPDFEDLNSLLSHFDEPFPDSSLLPTAILCEAVSQKAKVALSGDGGDEIFGGYRRMQAGLATENWGGLLRLLLNPLQSLPMGQPSPRSRRGFLLRMQKALEYPLTGRLLQWNSYFPRDSLSGHLGQSYEKLQSQLDHWEEILQGHEAGQRILYFNIKTYLFSDLLPKVDRMSMRYGLEVRSPFLDKELAEFVFKLPTAFKFSAWETKKCLKDSYRAALGSDIVDRTKHGFATPLTPVIQQWQKEPNGKTKVLQNPSVQGLSSLLDSQEKSTNYEACAFATWSAAVNLEKSLS